MRICRKCGHSLNETKNRCSHCGSVYSQKPIRQKSARTGTEARRGRTEKCWYCGWRNPAERTFCSLCGLSQVNIPRNGKSNISITGILVVLLLVSCLVVVMIAGHGSNTLEPMGISESAVCSLIEEEYRLILAADEKNINPFLETLISGFEVDVQSVREENGSYCAVCRFINYDAAQALEQINQQTEEQTWADYMDILLQRMKDLPRKETNVEMRVIYDMDQGSYVVQFDMSQLDAAMGGFISFAAQMGG